MPTRLTEDELCWLQQTWIFPHPSEEDSCAGNLLSTGHGVFFPALVKVPHTTKPEASVACPLGPDCLCATEMSVTL